jgi:hypothetical protein
MVLGGKLILTSLVFYMNFKEIKQKQPLESPTMQFKLISP